MGFKSSFGFPAVLMMGAVSFGVPVAWADMLVIEGDAQVIDTTTVEIWGQRIHLSGISAPDPSSPEGESGTRFLQRFLAGVRLRCEVQEASFSTEMVGHCFAANVDIAEPLVRMGYAQKLGAIPVGKRDRTDDAKQRRLADPETNRGYERKD